MLVKYNIVLGKHNSATIAGRPAHSKLDSAMDEMRNLRSNYEVAKNKANFLNRLCSKHSAAWLEEKLQNMKALASSVYATIKEQRAQLGEMEESRRRELEELSQKVRKNSMNISKVLNRAKVDYDDFRLLAAYA